MEFLQGSVHVDLLCHFTNWFRSIDHLSIPRAIKRHSRAYIGNYMDNYIPVTVSFDVPIQVPFVVE